MKTNRNQYARRSSQSPESWVDLVRSPAKDTDQISRGWHQLGVCVLMVKTQFSGVKFEIEKTGNVSPRGLKKMIFLRVENSNSLLHLTSCFLMTFLKRLSVRWGGETARKEKSTFNNSS